jgi:GTP-binding protein Era
VSEDAPETDAEQPEPSGPTRCGLVALLGRTNVGKSTLLNELVGAKVAIATPRRQTTTRSFHGVWTEGDAQAVFVDTPGLHKPEDREGERMLGETRSALVDIDLVLVVVEPGDTNRGGTSHVLQSLERAGSPPALLVVNKTDTLEPRSPLVRETVVDLTKAYPFERFVPISAKTGEGLDLLGQEILSRLPDGPWLYPPDEVSNVPQRFYAAEIVREKAMELTRDEIPHALGVEVTELAKDEAGDWRIRATIFVDRESRKGILIGAHGKKIHQIRKRAKRDLEETLEASVDLQLKVAVRKAWRNKRSTRHKKKKRKRKR